MAFFSNLTGNPFGSAGVFGNPLQFVGGQWDQFSGGALAWERAQQAASAQRAWLAMMSNTAHQRQVRDLRLAGLNPILSVRGAGAAVPSAQAAAVPPPGGQSMMSAMQLIPQLRGVATAAKVATSQINANNAQAQLSLTNARLAESKIPTKPGAHGFTYAGVRDAMEAKERIQENISTSAKKAKRAIDEIRKVREQGDYVREQYKKRNLPVPKALKRDRAPSRSNYPTGFDGGVRWMRDRIKWFGRRTKGRY